MDRRTPGRTLVRESDEESSSGGFWESVMTTEDARKLFVAGLPESMTEDVLRQLFEATGSQVVEVSMPRDRASGRPRGFGFVTLQTGEQAERSRATLDGSVQAGRAISVRPFQAGSPRREGKPESPSLIPAEERTLYVGNLPYDATLDEVEQVLAKAGVAPVIRIHLPVGPDGRPRGFGFVTLASPDAVLLAIAGMQTAELRGRRVMVKVAHPRGAAPIGGQSPRATGVGPSQAPAAFRTSGSRPDMALQPTHVDPTQLQRSYRAPEPSRDFEEEEDSEGARASAKSKSSATARSGSKASKAAAAKRKGERVVDDRRNRGGAASWQRWEDWDDD